MITRMTIARTGAVSRNDKFHLAVDEAKQVAIFYFNCASLFQHLTDFPTANIKDAFKSFFPQGEHVTVRKVSKIERTYNFCGCVITEKDTDL